MILCCGEALTDMIPAPAKAGRDGFVPHCGGAVFHTAIALGPLGVPAQTVEIAGMRDAGDRFNAGLLAKLSKLGQFLKPALQGLSPATLAKAMPMAPKSPQSRCPARAPIPLG